MNSQLATILEELYSFVDYEKLTSPPTYGTTVSDLDRFKEWLARRGSSQDSFPSILIAGSKGKGSVAAMLESVLRAAGYKTGLYTSPHLCDIRERIRINGRCIEEHLLASSLEKLIEAAKNDRPAKSYRTVFEILTASAFELFAKQKVDIAIVEVGMGGRLDATNILDPILTIITAIGLDHTETLGNTIEKIALEKAGIMRSGIPLVIGPQMDSVSDVLLNAALDNSTNDILEVSKKIAISEIQMWRDGSSFSISADEFDIKNLYINLLGSFQLGNAATAVAAIFRLCEADFNIPEDAIREGLGNVIWPARMQLFHGEPLLIVDGAHSPSAVTALIDNIEALWPEVRPTYIFAANRDKDIRGMLDRISKSAKRIILTKFDWPRAAEPKKLEALIPNQDIEIHSAQNPKVALKNAEELVAEKELIVATGSLYLAGEMLKLKGYIPCEHFCQPKN